MIKKCCNFFKNSYIYSVQTGSKRQFNLKHADINFVNLTENKLVLFQIGIHYPPFFYGDLQLSYVSYLSN